MATNQFTLRVVVNNEKADKKGLVPIYAKMMINGQKLELSTNRKIQSTDWLSDQEVSSTDADLNQFLEIFKARLYKAY